MTSEHDHARLIADRIARRVSQTRNRTTSAVNREGADVGAELSAMRASLDSLRLKLVQLESRLGNNKNTFAYTTPVSHFVDSQMAAGHPSQERFGVEEATVSELVDFFEGDKKCELEPGGKPCDHCALCSSRGF